MTTAEALAVVREALEDAPLGLLDKSDVGPALTALALIEQEMERLFRENNRLGDALAYERNEIAPAERRVAELEAALRDEKDKSLAYFDKWVEAEKRNSELEVALRARAASLRTLARRALGGGE